MDNQITTSIRQIPCLYIIKNFDWTYIYLNRWPNSDRGGFTLTIASSFGAWSHGWGSPGGDPIAFLKRINEDYLLGKLSNGREEFNSSEFKKGVKEYIIEERKRESIDADTARRAWDELEEVCSDYSDHEIPNEIYHNRNAINVLFGHDPEYLDFGNTYPRQLKGWYKYFWTDLLENLHQFELEPVIQ